MFTICFFPANRTKKQTGLDFHLQRKLTQRGHTSQCELPFLITGSSEDNSCSNNTLSYNFLVFNWGHQEEMMGWAMEGVTSRRVPRSRLEMEGEQEQRVSLQHLIRPRGLTQGASAPKGQEGLR